MLRRENDLLPIVKMIRGENSWQARTVLSHEAHYRWVTLLNSRDLLRYSEAMRLDSLAAEENRSQHFRAAVADAEREVAILNELHVPRSVVYAELLQFLGTLRWLSTDYVGYRRELRESMLIISDAVGDASPQFAEVTAEFGNYYKLVGDLERARKLCGDACDKYAKAVGKDDEGYAGFLRRVAVIDACLGRVKQAEASLQKTIRLCKKISLRPDELCAICDATLADLYRQIGEYSAAEPLLLEATYYDEFHYGADDARCITVHRLLGSLYTAMGKLDLAEPLLRSALRSATTTFSEDDGCGDLSLATQSMADMYLVQKRYNEAAPLLRQSLLQQERLMGKDNPGLLPILRSYTTAMRETGHVREAEEADGRVKNLDSSLGRYEGASEILNIAPQTLLKSPSGRSTAPIDDLRGKEDASH